MSERLQAALRRRSLHLARRPVPRAHRDRQPRRPGQGQVGRRGHHQPDDLRRRRSPTASGTTTRCASSSPTAPTSTRRSSSSPPTTSATPATSSTPVYEATGGVDGRVSIEVAPDLAHDTDGTIAVRQGAVGGGRPRPTCSSRSRPPPRGLPAITDALAEGISVNVTLIFGLDRYERGHGRLPRRPRAGARQPARTCPGSTRSRRSSSPASTPRSTSGSRTIGTDEALALRGKAGVANARLAYEAYEEFFAGDRWQRARRRRRQHAAAAVGVHRREEPRLPRHDVRHRPGRRPTPSTRCRRRPWRRSPTTARSTATRSPAKYDEAQQVIDDLAGVGIDYDDVIEVLEQEGVDKFVKSWDELLETVSRASWRRPGMRPDGLEHRHRQGTPERSSSCPSATPTRRRSPRRSRSWSHDKVASRIAGAGRRRCGGRPPRTEAAKRLAWVALPETSRAAGRRDRGPPSVELARAGLDHVVLCGMGGSSLAPEVICAADGRRARPSSTPPTPTSSAPRSRTGSPRPSSCLQQVRRHRRDRQPAARLRAGVPRRRHRPGRADRRRHRPRLAAGAVGPRGRLPRLPRRPRRRRPLLRAHRVRAGAQRPGRRRHRRAARRGRGDPPGARGRLGRQPGPAARAPCSASANRGGVDKLVLADAGAPYPGFGDWAEQLIAESTGKDGKGILPVVVEGARRAQLRPEHARRGAGDDRRRLRVRHRPPGLRARRCRSTPRSGAQMLLWEYATAVAGRLIGINPFDQPDVESAKAAARAMLDGGGDPPDAGLRRRPGHGLRLRRAGCPTAPPRCADAVAGAARPARRRARLRRRPGLPRPAPRRRARRRPRRPGRAHRPAGHVRLGSAVPALDRPVPQGRAPHRRLPAGHRPAGRRPRGARPAVHVPASSSPPRRSATVRCSPTRAGRCCGCTSASRGRPRRRTTDAGVTAPATRTGSTRCATRRTAGCPGSPAPAGWCSSASPATCPARR